MFGLLFGARGEEVAVRGGQRQLAVGHLVAGRVVAHDRVPAARVQRAAVELVARRSAARSSCEPVERPRVPASTPPPSTPSRTRRSSAPRQPVHVRRVADVRPRRAVGRVLRLHDRAVGREPQQVNVLGNAAGSWPCRRAPRAELFVLLERLELAAAREDHAGLDEVAVVLVDHQPGVLVVDRRVPGQRASSPSTGRTPAGPAARCSAGPGRRRGCPASGRRCAAPRRRPTGTRRCGARPCSSGSCPARVPSNSSSPAQAAIGAYASMSIVDRARRARVGHGERGDVLARRRVGVRGVLRRGVDRPVGLEVPRVGHRGALGVAALAREVHGRAATAPDVSSACATPSAPSSDATPWPPNVSSSRSNRSVVASPGRPRNTRYSAARASSASIGVVCVDERRPARRRQQRRGADQRAVGRVQAQLDDAAVAAGRVADRHLVDAVQRDRLEVDPVAGVGEADAAPALRAGHGR